MCARGEAGVSLVETLVSMLVLTVGSIGLASVFVYGVQSASSSPNELLATQKAAEAIESVFSARDSQTITWAELQNVSDNGIFVDGATPLFLPGPDGILNTIDDEEVVETVTTPGPDGVFGGAEAGGGDDVTKALEDFTREIVITPITPVLRQVTVTITYQAGAAMRTYTLTALISAWA